MTEWLTQMILRDQSRERLACHSKKFSFLTGLPGDLGSREESQVGKWGKSTQDFGIRELCDAVDVEVREPADWNLGVKGRQEVVCGRGGPMIPCPFHALIHKSSLSYFNIKFIKFQFFKKEYAWKFTPQNVFSNAFSFKMHISKCIV